MCTGYSMIKHSRMSRQSCVELLKSLDDLKRLLTEANTHVVFHDIHVIFHDTSSNWLVARDTSSRREYVSEAYMWRVS